MRKYISFVIAAVVLVASFVLPASAATTGVLEIADVSGKPGDTVAVNVDMSQNPGLVTMSIKIEYDANVLQLTDVKDTGVLSGARLNKQYSSPYTITWVDGSATQNNTKTGTIVTFCFTIKDGAAEGKSPVTLLFMDSYTTDYHANQFETKSGSVIIGSKDASQNESNTGSNAGNGGQQTPAETIPAQTTPAVTVPVVTPPVPTVPEQSASEGTEPTEITTDETVETKDESAQNPESSVITIGTMPAETVENQQKDPAFPWWILLVLIPGVAVAVVLIIKKVKK